MSTCPKHGCVITETITDDVFCGVCRIAEMRAEIDRLRKALDDIAHSARTKTGMKEMARAALAGNAGLAGRTGDQTMFNHAKIGDREVIEQVEMPEATKEVLREILAQNRMILEANCMTMRMIGQPMMFIAKAGDRAG